MDENGIAVKFPSSSMLITAMYPFLMQPVSRWVVDLTFLSSIVQHSIKVYNVIEEL